MGEFKNIRKLKARSKEVAEDAEILGEKIKRRGSRTIKIPNASDKKTGDLILKQKKTARTAGKLMNMYKRKRNAYVGKTGGKIALVGAAMYGGKRLIDDHNSETEKYAGYGKRVKDSLGRTLSFGRTSKEIGASARKAERDLKRALRKKDPDTAELGHLNAKKVKETADAASKRKAEIVAKVSAPAAAVSGGYFVKKKIDESEPARQTHFFR